MKFLKIFLIILCSIALFDLSYRTIRRMFPKSFGYDFYSGTVLSVGACNHSGGPSDNPEYREVISIQTSEGRNLAYSIYCDRFHVGDKANFLVEPSGRVVDDDRNFASTMIGSLILFIVSLIPIFLVFWFL